MRRHDEVVVWLGANTLTYPEGGGHLWAYLNWALGLRQVGCRVVWLEHIDAELSRDAVAGLLRSLRERLAPYGLSDAIALFSAGGDEDFAADLIPIGSAKDAALYLNLAYQKGGAILPHFRRTALIDIDPGLLQVWMTDRAVKLPPHDRYFTIGENVGSAAAIFPNAGLDWIYTPPCVSLEHWPVVPAREDAPFTTISHWGANEWFGFNGEVFANDKRTGFAPFLDLPRHTKVPLELALCLGADEQLRLLPHEAEERDHLVTRGWRVVHSQAVSATPRDYQRYVQQSRGEFSCAKPAFVRLQPGWVSDRTICYLASGRPAVVQHTGPSRFLPEAEGMFRFRDLPEAIRALETIAADYEHHSARARELAEEYFSAAKVVPRLLERALG